jgi:hypothetical protein
MNYSVILLGGTNQIGSKLIQYFEHNNILTGVISRNLHPNTFNVKYIEHDIDNNLASDKKIKCDILISLIDSVKSYRFIKFNVLTKHLIQLSSTSVFSKINSKNINEKIYYNQLLKTDRCVIEFCAQKKIIYTIYRTTLIYDTFNDKNISMLQNLILKLNFMILVDYGKGLRQPIKSIDVATIIFENLQNNKSYNDDFILIGGETLTYKSICDRIFLKNSLKPRYINIPNNLFRLIYYINLKIFKFTILDFLYRTSVDLVFEDTKAKYKLTSYNPSKFEL